MQKIDLKKELRQLYQPSTKAVAEVVIPTLSYLMIDGQGDPNTSQDFAEAVEALFAVSYAAKFMVKKGPQSKDYAVMPLEGLWWSDDMAEFTIADKSKWKWTAMIMQPPFVPRQVIESAIEQVGKKKSLPALAKIRLESLSEGHCAQLMHVGPFSNEGPNIAKVHEFIKARGKPVGKHHEIYLSDIRKADPAKWKTVIRQPMQ
jgi:hypothetical protein